MRKQSFLYLSVILMLFFSACTKESVENYNPSAPSRDYPQDAYSVSYSNWTSDANLSWSDGGNAEPSRQATLTAPELTQEMIDGGSVVLMYAQSNVNDSVQIMPVEYTDANNNETNFYSSSHVEGSITVLHTRTVDGVFEMPEDVNEISFRYITVTPNSPDPNGRQLTIDQFLNMPYKDVVALLGVPE